MPKVSVIIPVYGVEKYIERCARSLFEQTLDDIEFIFVDDCTPDKSIEILESIIEEYRLRFAEEKKTVRIERMPTNSGLAAVRRHGIQLATGDYIIHCDSDDWVDVDMYRAMYEKAIEDGADVVVCDFYRHDGKSIIRSDRGLIHTDHISFLKDMLYYKVSVAVWNKLVRNTLYSKIEYYPNGNMGEDLVISTQNIYNSCKLSYVNKPLYYYYFNVESITKVNSSESQIKRFNQLYSNIRLVELFLSSKPSYLLFSSCLNWARFSVKSRLYTGNLNIDKYRKGLFPFVEIKILFCMNIPLQKRFLGIKIWTIYYIKRIKTKCHIS